LVWWLAAGPEDALWEGANARIEKHRKAGASVVVVDAAGKPISAAKVTVEQTRHAFWFGCNIFLWGRAGDEKLESAYRQQFAEIFNFATLPYYWFAYEPAPDRPQHERAEAVARWCREQGIVTKGHPLAWNYADPRWLPDDLEEVRRRQMARIDDCVRRFRGLVDVWDVVNEATHFDREECQKRAPKLTRLWTQTGRVAFVRQCFDEARPANPAATLLINDYRTDEAYARLLTELAAEGRRPFDVIGIQSHMHGGVWNIRKTWEVCERFGRFGVPLHFTETTILSGEAGWERGKGGTSWPSTKEGEAAQARDVERFYTTVFSHPATQAITWWDFSDRGAWQRAPAGLVRADMSPKPAYERLKELIKGRWWTKTELATNSEGKADFRGFLGEYRVTAVVGTRRVSMPLTLSKDGPNRVMVRVP
jgi:GH35 family endo-1,4-beta-xylanase